MSSSGTRSFRLLSVFCFSVLLLYLNFSTHLCDWVPYEPVWFARHRRKVCIQVMCGYLVTNRTTAQPSFRHRPQDNSDTCCVLRSDQRRYTIHMHANIRSLCTSICYVTIVSPTKYIIFSCRCGCAVNPSN